MITSSMNKFFSLILFLIASSVYSEELIQVKCSLFDFKGNLVYRWPQSGEMCLFFDNGYVVAADFDQMKKFDNKGNLLWSIPGYFHHQMKLGQDKKRIYILGAKTNDFLGGKVRMDTVDSIDLENGKHVAQFELFNFLKELAVDPTLSLHRGFFQKSLFPYDFDLSHANSIFEIPENNLSNINPAFQKGNWLINIGMLRQFIIVDRDLKNLLWHKNWNPEYFDVHDVQLNKNSELVVYVNGVNSSQGKITVVHHVDPLSEKANTFLKSFTPLVNGKPFFQHFVGGVQERDNGDILLSVLSQDKGFELALFGEKNELKMKFVPLFNLRGQIGVPFQEGRIIEVGNFLKNRSDN
jgi:hypothetical protein